MTRLPHPPSEVIAAYAEPSSNARALALFYLSSHVGAVGHNCPVACTAGVVKALRAQGSAALTAMYLPGLLTDYRISTGTAAVGRVSRPRPGLVGGRNAPRGDA